MINFVKGFILSFIVFFGSLPLQAQQHSLNSEIQENPPIYIAFLWHMHQPIYRPGQDIIETDGSGEFSYSVVDIHNSRTGPYTTWPSNAVQKGIDAGLAHLGASVSFSGSLISNLNRLEEAGRGFANWKNPWISMAQNKTTLGNDRIDLIGFGFHHPLMGLVDYDDIRHQIAWHKEIITSTFGTSYSKGIFPPENAFTPRMIPALVDEGIEWVLVDNIHFERATVNYPYSVGGNLYEPNKADQLNADPGDWVQLNGVWAPTQVSAQWGHQPHYVEYTNPETGATSKILAVPTSRYLGNEDGRGGFGALNYESVMSQLESYNTDPDHPILIVLHHDGDNFGGGSESYYGSNFQAFVNWLESNPSRFVGTTIQDYLDQFPPDENDVIHIEDGSWAGADNGDPEFLKWLGKPGEDGYSPDRNSWAILTAVKNAVKTVEIENPSHSGLEEARKMLSNAQASDYWYWDGTEIWDSNPAKAGNLALVAIDGAWNQSEETVPPTIFIPQRSIYNPGGDMWEQPQPSAFTIWTYAYDVSGLDSVVLRYKVDGNQTWDLEDKRYNLSSWQSNVMSEVVEGSSRTIPIPNMRANRFEATLSEISESYVDYYVAAFDKKGNESKSPIRRVYVGSTEDNGGGNGGDPGGKVSWTPTEITDKDSITIRVRSFIPGKLHWGINPEGPNWTTPAEEYLPEGTTLFNGTGPAVETPLSEADTSGIRTVKIGPFNKDQIVKEVAFVFHFDNDVWDNNNGQDYRFMVENDTSRTNDGKENDYLEPSFFYVMDGERDENSVLVAKNGSIELYAGFNGRDLYVSSQSGNQTGNDVFLIVASDPTTLTEAPWGKSGQVAEREAFIGNESSNSFAGWFDGTENAQAIASTSTVEGFWDLSQRFESKPDSLFLAVGRYQTDDGGALVAQAPAGNDDGNISIEEFEVFYLEDIISTSKEKDRIEIPSTITLSNYPNPFNPSTVVSYSLPERSNVHIRVYNIMGQEVATLVSSQTQAAGNHSVTWNAINVSSGVYFIHLMTETQHLISKALLIK